MRPANEDRDRPLTSTFLHQGGQGALGAYSGVTYINVRMTNDNKSEVDVNSWEEDQ